MVYDTYDRYQVKYRLISYIRWYTRYIGLHKVKYVIQISDMCIGYDIAWPLLSWCILCLLDAYFVRVMYDIRIYSGVYITCIMYHSSTSWIRNARTPAGAYCLLLPCCRAALIRNEWVARAFARGDERCAASSSRLRHRPAPPVCLSLSKGGVHFLAVSERSTYLLVQSSSYCCPLSLVP